MVYGCPPACKNSLMQVEGISNPEDMANLKGFCSILNIFDNFGGRKLGIADNLGNWMFLISPKTAFLVVTIFNVNLYDWHGCTGIVASITSP